MSVRQQFVKPSTVSRVPFAQQMAQAAGMTVGLLPAPGRSATTTTEETIGAAERLGTMVNLDN